MGQACKRHHRGRPRPSRCPPSLRYGGLLRMRGGADTTHDWPIQFRLCMLALRPTSRSPPMHNLSIPADLVQRVIARAGRPHPFDVMAPAKTAFVVVDMQNYFVKPGFQGEVPKARAIVPAINRLAATLRELGGHVVWVKNT